MQYKNTQSLCRRGKASRPPRIADRRFEIMGKPLTAVFMSSRANLPPQRTSRSCQFVVIADLKSFEGPELQASVKARISANALR